MKKYTILTIAWLLASVCIKAQVTISDAYNSGGTMYDFGNAETVNQSAAGVGYVANNAGRFYHWGSMAGTLTVKGLYNAYNPNINGFAGTTSSANIPFDYFQGLGGLKGTAQEIAGTVAPIFGNLNLDNGNNQINITNTAGILVGGMAVFANGITTTVRSYVNTGALRFMAGSGYNGSVGNNLSFNNAAADAQHVDGYVGKVGNTAFVYPVGSPTDARPLQIGGGGSATQEFDVAWIAGDPTITADPSDPVGAKLHPFNSVGPGVTAVSKLGQWDFIQAAGVGNGSGLTVTVSIPDQTSFAVASNLILVGWNGTQWVNLSGSAQSGPYASGNTENSILVGIMTAGISAIGIGTSTTVLPVTLTNFTTAKQGDIALLSWQVAMEQNVNVYVVERSVDGSGFATIGTIASLGNTATSRSYSLIDKLPFKGANYYRLKIIDKDGTVAYSSISLLNFDSPISISIYPNPVRERANVSGLEAGMVLKLTNIYGQVISQQPTLGNTATIATGMLASGIYQVQLFGANGELISTTKLVKQ